MGKRKRRSFTKEYNAVIERFFGMPKQELLYEPPLQTRERPGHRARREESVRLRHELSDVRRLGIVAKGAPARRPAPGGRTAWMTRAFFAWAPVDTSAASLRCWWSSSVPSGSAPWWIGSMMSCCLPSPSPWASPCMHSSAGNGRLLASRFAGGREREAPCTGGHVAHPEIRWEGLWTGPLRGRNLGSR